MSYIEDIGHQITRVLRGFAPKNSSLATKTVDTIIILITLRFYS